MVGSHDPDVGVRDRERVMPGLPVVQELRDTEVEKLRHARSGHQDVRGLEIAMHDEVLMRVVHGGADGLEQLETGRDVQAERIAIGIDRCAVDVLHDDVSGLVRQRAAVEEVRDVGMVELRQDLPLDLEPRRAPRGRPRRRARL